MFNLLVTQLAFTALLDQGLKAGKTPLGHVSLPCMVHGLDDGSVGVLQLRVLADQSNIHHLKQKICVTNVLFSFSTARCCNKQI